MPDNSQRIAEGLIVLNPSAGDGEAKQLRTQLRDVLGDRGFDLLELEDDMSLCERVSSARRDHTYQWIAAAGGDGTVSKVGSCAVNFDLPLGIIPAGTGNAIAAALGIPEDIEEACRLLIDPGATRTIDAIRINDRHYFLQVGVGLEALTMQETTSEQKNKLGTLAYLLTAVREASGWQPHHFDIIVDGRRHALEASELVLANLAEVGVFGLRWGEDIAPDDGLLDVVAINAHSAGDYLEVLSAMSRGSQAQSDLFTVFRARETVGVETDRPLPIHGDGGDVEDPWPLDARLIPQALSVIVPLV
ncbi:MAG: diacylglycerol/lipid kinase family protein [Candidatus Promineifilaceae bacterium]